MKTENPFRMSKFQLSWRVLFMVALAIASSAAGCGNPFGIAFFIVAGFFGSILAYKISRDMNAENPHHPVDIYAHEATRRLGQPTPHPTHATQSAESNKLELFRPPTDL